MTAALYRNVVTLVRTVDTVRVIRTGTITARNPFYKHMHGVRIAIRQNCLSADLHATKLR